MRHIDGGFIFLSHVAANSLPHQPLNQQQDALTTIIVYRYFVHLFFSLIQSMDITVFVDIFSISQRIEISHSGTFQHIEISYSTEINLVE